MKTLVIGLDGATYNVLEPLIEQGRLPNLERLIDTGVSGALKSTVPPATYPAWKCYSTGKHPTRLEFHSFLNFEDGTLEPASTDAMEIWDYVSEADDTAVSINMPTTYPAKEVNGFMTSGYVIGGEDYVYPAELKSTLEEEFDYKPEVSFPVHTELISEDTSEQRAEMRAIMQSRFDLASFAVDALDPDFLQVTLYYTDTYQHFFWNDEAELHEMWEYVDTQIGELLETVGDETNVFVVSDHGFHTLETGIFYVNKWLADEGYLSFQTTVNHSKLRSLGLHTKNLHRILDKLNLMDLARRLVPESYRRKVPNPRGEIGIDQFVEKIDWNESVAFFYGSVFLNSELLGSDYETVRSKLIEELEAITSPLTGKPVFAGVYRPEEIYEPKDINPRGNSKIPDLLTLTKDNGFASPAYTDALWNTDDLEGRWSVHARDGIFIASGPEIKEDEETNLEIFDVAPTILHLMGYPLDEDIDGRVANEIFEDASDPAERDVEYRGEREHLTSAIGEVVGKL